MTTDAERPQYLYRHFDKDNNLLYVGVSLSAVYRLAQHKNHSHWFEEIARVDIEKFGTRKQVLLAERNAIAQENPKYNLQRPTVKERVVSEKRNASELLLEKRVVSVNPVYSLAQVAEELLVSKKQVKEWVESGQIGSIVKRKYYDKRWNVERKVYVVTGWQLLEFLDNWPDMSMQSQQKEETK